MGMHGMTQGKKGVLKSLEKASSIFSDGKIHDLKSLRRSGVSSTYLSHLIEEGLIERVACGRYRVCDVDHSDYDEFARVSVRYPSSVICLRSAAMYHGMTTSLPYEVSISLPHSCRPPSSESKNLKTYRWRNPDFFKIGLKTISISGIKVTITDPARTLLDYLRPINGIPEEEIYEVMLSYFLDSKNDLATIANYAISLGIYNKIAENIKIAATFAEALPEKNNKDSKFTY